MKLIRIIAFVCLVAYGGEAFAQTNAGALLPALPQQFLTANGTPAANGRICTSGSGTNTPLAVYSDAGLTTPLPNPIKLNSAGIAITAGGTQTAVYTLARSYRVTLYAAGTTSNLCNGTAVGTLLWQFDNVYDFAQINGGSSGGGGGPQGQCNAAAQTGADAAAKITACAVSLPTSGGIINAEGLQGAQTWGACPSFPSSSITLLMGVGTTAITPTCSTPVNVEINFPIGSCLAPSSGHALQVNGPIDAGVQQQIFCGMGTTTTPGQSIVYPQWWGALANAVFLGGPLGNGSVGCTGTATSAVITCPSGAFTSADVGKKFDLSHAGTAACGQQYSGNTATMNCNLVGTILTVGSLTSITLSTAVLSSVTAEQFTYGNPDDTAVAAAFNSGAIQIGLAGSYVMGVTNSGTSLQVRMNNQSISAVAPGSGRLINIGPVAYDSKASSIFQLDNDSTNVTFFNIQFIGTNELGELTNNGGSAHDGLQTCTGGAGFNTSSATCNSDPNTAITNIKIINCEFNYLWGIGFHVQGATPGAPANKQTTGYYIQGGGAKFNSFDGYNPGINDNLILNGVLALNNGTGGLEAAVLGSEQIINSQFKFNHTIGLAVGGFNDNVTTMRACTITGNDMSNNGNGVTTLTPGGGTTQGNGITMSFGTQNCTITGNTIQHNHLYGIFMQGHAQDRNYNISGNVISSNGLVNATQLPVGIFISTNNGTISGNHIDNEAVAHIATVSRTSNVITCTTTGANNYQAGFSVTITGTAGAALDGTYTIATITTGATFTINNVGANAGPFTTGVTFSPGFGFDQQDGIQVNSNVADVQILHNYIFNNHNANFDEAGLSGLINVVYATDQIPYNPVGSSFWDISLGTNVPSVGGLTIRIPDVISVVANACTTAASAAATCTSTITHNMATNTNASGAFNLITSCQLDNSPNAQTGKPFIPQINNSTNTSSVVIETSDGNAAGNGSLRCRTNFQE